MCVINKYIITYKTRNTIYRNPRNISLLYIAKYYYIERVGTIGFLNEHCVPIAGTLVMQFHYVNACNIC